MKKPGTQALNATTVTLCPQDYQLLKEALAFYRFESRAAFFRGAAQTLIAHYQRAEALDLPLASKSSAELLNAL